MIYDNCKKLFKKEDSNKPKEASLIPIIKMIKNIEEEEYVQHII